MSKPDWKDAPDLAEWLAQDGNGVWWWYAQRPILSLNGWRLRHVYIGAVSLACRDFENGNWQKTLDRRPVAGKECK